MKTKEHINGMVDISDKELTKRRAVAAAKVQMTKETFKIFIEQGSPKGNVLETAKIAGVMAAKLTPMMIPMCHPLELSKVKINFSVDKKKYLVDVESEVVCCGRTGVEMEALTAVSAAALTIYDMMKFAGQGMVITNIQLLHKSGGKSGVYEKSRFV